MKKTALFLVVVIAGMLFARVLAQSESAAAGRAAACPCGWCSRGPQGEVGAACGCGWCTAAADEPHAGCMCARLLNAATVRVTQTAAGVVVEMTSDNPDVVKHLQEWWSAGEDKGAPESAGEAKAPRGCSCPWCRK